MHLGPPLWVLVLMMIAIGLLIRFNELKQVILYGNVKGMVGDPPNSKRMVPSTSRSRNNTYIFCKRVRNVVLSRGVVSLVLTRL